MAGGRAPSPQLSRPNDQARREAASTKVAADGVLRGPELPDGEWHERTLAWWQTWRRSPQAQAFAETDWDVLAETALLHTRMWNGQVSIAPELRLRVAKFGATVEDRLRLKMLIQSDIDEVKTAKPVMATDRRRRLLKAVADGS
jgi:hypothetical protein